MGRNIERMRKAIAEARAVRKEPPAKKPCCSGGWADIHTAKCPKNKDRKRAK